MGWYDWLCSGLRCGAGKPFLQSLTLPAGQTGDGGQGMVFLDLWCDCHPRTIGNVWVGFQSLPLGRGLLLASSGGRPGVLLCISQSTGERYLAPLVSAEEADKCCPRGETAVGTEAMGSSPRTPPCLPVAALPWGLTPRQHSGSCWPSACQHGPSYPTISSSSAECVPGSGPTGSPQDSNRHMGIAPNVNELRSPAIVLRT